MNNDPYYALKRQVEQDNHLPSGIIDYLIAQESGKNPNAVSNKGAGGIMQLMPDTAHGLGLTDQERFDPLKAIPAGGKYLGQQLKRFGTLPLALAAYNAGPEAVAKYGSVPPYAETQNYVDAITTKFGSAQPVQSPPVAPIGSLAAQPLQPQLLNPTIGMQPQQPQQQPAPVPDKNPMLKQLGDKLGLPETVSDYLANTDATRWQGMAEYGMGAGMDAAKPQLGQQDAFQVMPTLISILLNPNLGGVRSRKRII